LRLSALAPAFDDLLQKPWARFFFAHQFSASACLASSDRGLYSIAAAPAPRTIPGIVFAPHFHLDPPRRDRIHIRSSAIGAAHHS
jgi:hypothetical protein